MMAAASAGEMACEFRRLSEFSAPGITTGRVGTTAVGTIALPGRGTTLVATPVIGTLGFVTGTVGPAVFSGGRGIP